MPYVSIQRKWHPTMRHEPRKKEEYEHDCDYEHEHEHEHE
jgi:hypothetical protein